MRGTTPGVRPYSLRVIWGPVLPQDSTKLAGDEQVLVRNGIHSRRRAMDELGVKEPEREFKRWLEEREAIGNTDSRFKIQDSRTPAAGKAGP